MSISITNYFKETKNELTGVNWPSRRQTIAYTIVVVVFSLGLAAVLGVFDLLFNYLIKLLI